MLVSWIEAPFDIRIHLRPCVLNAAAQFGRGCTLLST